MTNHNPVKKHSIIKDDALATEETYLLDEDFDDMEVQNDLNWQEFNIPGEHYNE